MSSSTSSTSSNVTVLGRSISRQDIKKIFYGSVGFFVVINTALLPFALPFTKRFFGAPFVPTRQESINSLFNHPSLKSLTQNNKRFIDLGSGDGRLVIEASKTGFSNALGIEMNPWLLLKSKYNAWKQSAVNAEFRLRNFHDFLKTSNLNDPNSSLLITLYGLPDINAKLGTEIETYLKPTESNHQVIVASHHFTIPGWSHKEIGSVNGTEWIFYQLNKSSST
jgi:Methyltransferase domain